MSTADWVFESVLQFLKSPLWTTPVHGFIEQHCGEFTGEDENKIEHTVVHKEFCRIVDELLSGYLADLGVPPEDFIEACKAGTCRELSDMVTEYILSMDDFRTFRAMMERKSHEVELEAMYEYAKVTEAAAAMDDSEMDDEERFLLEMAIKASLTPADVQQKQAEVEDAELLEALAMSMALEQERLLKQQLEEESADRKQAELEDEARDAMDRLNNEFLQRRMENVERHASAPQQQAATPVATSAGAGSPERPGVMSRVLAPVGERRAAAGPAFGAPKVPLPGIPSGGLQPAFSELQRSVEQPPAAGGQAPSAAPAKPQHGPSEEEMKQRAAYLKEQRERLLKAKAEQRQQELAKFQQEQGGAQATPGKDAKDTGASTAPPDAVRAALVQRFKEDVLQETRRAAARGDAP